MKFSNVLVASVLMAALVSFPSYAKKSKWGNNECPVGLVSEKTMDAEFGEGTQALTKCLEKRNQVKMVVQLNQYEVGGKVYGLGNIKNIIDDYETTHGMTRGKDYEIVAVIHSAGGRLALKNTGLNSASAEVSGRNAYEQDVMDLMDMGVKFYFCQNTTRAYLGQPAGTITSLPPGNATAQLIPGMLYTTAGLTSIADFQHKGYQYIQP